MKNVMLLSSKALRAVQWDNAAGIATGDGKFEQKMSANKIQTEVRGHHVYRIHVSDTDCLYVCSPTFISEILSIGKKFISPAEPAAPGPGILVFADMGRII